jgi:putative cardiolipin synthase
MQTRDDAAFAMLAAQPNVHVRLFNPFSNRILRHTAFITNFDRSNRRMHNKALIADGVLAITGGRNIGDEYFSANKSVEFGDLDLLMIGNAVPQVEQQFDKYWNSTNAHPIEHYHQINALPQAEQWALWEDQITKKTRHSAYFKSLLNTPLLIQLKNQNLPFYWGKAEVIYDNPNKVSGDQTHNPLLDAITDSLTNAKHEYLLISPYFVPTKAGTQALVNAVKQGKQVTIITNSLASNDVFSVHGWYAKYRKALLKGGVIIYETKAPPQMTKQKRSMTGSSRTSLHAKSFIVDHKEVFVGSFNFDPRSAHLNTEMGVFIDSPAFANDIYDALQVQLKKHAYRLKLNKKNQLEWIDDSTNKIYTTEPDASLWQRIGAKASGWLPIEKHL